MSPQYLDLQQQDISEVAGKLLVLNGVKYILHPLSGEGGETFIFPLENIESGLINFVAKIYKFRPEADEFEERKRTRNNGFVLSMIGVPVLHEEHYEISGALIKFQRYEAGGSFIGIDSGYASDPVPRPETRSSYSDMQQTALSQLANHGLRQASDIINSILRANPRHTEALHIGVEILIKNKQYEPAIDMAKSAIQIDCNDVRFYHLIARAYILLSQPIEAINILDVALERYEWEFGSWELKREVATRFGLWDVLSEMQVDAENKLENENHSGSNEKMKASVSRAFVARRETGASFYIEPERTTDLTSGLKLLIEILSLASEDPQLRADFACEIARLGCKWREHWLGRVIGFLAYSFFLFEPMEAVDLYGGPVVAMQALEAENAETYFLRGFSAVFRNEFDNSFNYFSRARELSPNDPFILFGLIVGLKVVDREKEVDEAILTMHAEFSNHPITALAQRFGSD